MDEMNITSKFMTSVITKIICTVLKKQGYNIDIQFNEIKATVTDGKAHVHLNVDAEIEKEEILRILKNAGLA